MFWFPIFYLWCIASPILRPQLANPALCSWFPASFHLLCYHWALIYKHTFQCWRIFWSDFISPLVSFGPSVIQMFSHLNFASHFLYLFFFLLNLTCLSSCSTFWKFSSSFSSNPDTEFSISAFLFLLPKRAAFWMFPFCGNWPCFMGAVSSPSQAVCDFC